MFLLLPVGDWLLLGSTRMSGVLLSLFNHSTSERTSQLKNNSCISVPLVIIYKSGRKDVNMTGAQVIAIMAAILRPTSAGTEDAVRLAREILAEVERQRAETGRKC